MFPFSRIPLWVHIFDPQPYLVDVKTTSGQHVFAFKTFDIFGPLMVQNPSRQKLEVVGAPAFPAGPSGRYNHGEHLVNGFFGFLEQIAILCATVFTHTHTHQDIQSILPPNTIHIVSSHQMFGAMARNRYQICNVSNMIRFLPTKGSLQFQDRSFAC